MVYGFDIGNYHEVSAGVTRLTGRRTRFKV